MCFIKTIIAIQQHSFFLQVFLQINRASDKMGRFSMGLYKCQVNFLDMASFAWIAFCRGV
jgi:hypothetical protein